MNKIYQNPDLWQSKQAAMLLHFASMDYLKGLQKLVNDLITGVVDPLLDLAESQNRDSVLIDPIWGNRNTSENWGNNAWPILKDLQAAIARDIALRANGHFEITAVNECLQGINQYSLEWMNPQEERFFNFALQTMSVYASEIDDTLSAPNDNRWTDYGFAYSYPTFASQRKQIPKFRIRRDIVGESGLPPPKTGVYIAQDDPNAAIQFAWTGSDVATLRNANTFNEIGLAALGYVGRDKLWFDSNKMYDFATLKEYEPLFHNMVFIDGLPDPDLAPSAVARIAFTQRPAKWFFLEIIEGEFAEIEKISVAGTSIESQHRVVGGEKCAVAGYYFTPSMMNSRRHLASGEVAPKFDTRYGQTIWQWDINQE